MFPVLADDGQGSYPVWDKQLLANAIQAHPLGDGDNEVVLRHLVSIGAVVLADYEPPKEWFTYLRAALIDGEQFVKFMKLAVEAVVDKDFSEASNYLLAAAVIEDAWGRTDYVAQTATALGLERKFMWVPSDPNLLLQE